MKMKRKNRASLLGLVLVLALASMGVGCPKDPYRASLSGSAKVADAVHEAVTAEIEYYGMGKLTDEEKLFVAGYLTAITNSNMKFRHDATDLHNRDVVGKAAYLDLAQVFVNAVPTDPLAFGYKNPDAQKKFNTVLGAVKTAINLVSLTVQNAKGGQ